MIMLSLYLSGYARTRRLNKARHFFKGLTYTEAMVNLRSRPREEDLPMKEYRSLSHTRWDCKYLSGPVEILLCTSPPERKSACAIRKSHRITMVVQPVFEFFQMVAKVHQLSIAPIL